MLRILLVPLDGSPLADHALEIATVLARRAGAALRLVHVQSPGGADVEDPADPARAAASRYVAERVTRLEESGVAVSGTLRSGAVVSNILEEAHESGADLIVLASHGQTGPSAAWLGSVADGLARQADVPLLFVRSPSGAGEQALAFDVQRILVPLDGSEEAEQVLDVALTFAHLTGAALTLLVVDVLPILIGEEPVEVGTRVDVAEQWRRGEHYLERLAPRLRDEGVSIDVALRADRSPAAAILDEAQRVDAGLIALATHGRSRLRRLFIGSVADKVLRDADVPVLLVRPVHPAAGTAGSGTAARAAAATPASTGSRP